MNQLVTNVIQFDFSEQQICAIKELKKLVEDSAELHIGTEDKFLSKFLYFSNWDVNKAFENINGYYDFKLAHDEFWITNKSPEDFKDVILNTGARYLLPKCDKNGANVFDQYPDFIDILRQLDDLILETIVATRRGQENGISIIIDLRNFSKRYLKFIQPKHLMTISKKNRIFPLNKRKLHIQIGFILSVVTGLVLPIVGGIFEKDTIYHRELKSEKLKEMIGYEALPHEYGGPEENVLDGNVLYNFLLENKDFVKKVQSYNKVQ